MLSRAFPLVNRRPGKASADKTTDDRRLIDVN
jgi:hypothetical protein